MMLLGVLHDGQADGLVKRGGYKCAYDFITNRLVVRPYVSGFGMRPLDQPWFSPDSESTDTSFADTPGTLAQRFISQDCKTPEPDKIHNSSQRGFTLIIHFVVSKWILSFWKALQTLEPELLTDDVFDKLQKKAKEYFDEVTALPFPHKIKTDEDDDHDEAMAPFGLGLSDALTKEDRFRDLALAADRCGNNEYAEEVMKFYARTMDALRSLGDGKP